MRRAAAKAMAETDPKTVQDLTAVVSAGGSSGARRPSGQALEEPLSLAPSVGSGSASGPFCPDHIRYHL